MYHSAFPAAMLLVLLPGFQCLIPSGRSLPMCRINYDFALIRYNTNGSLDDTYGNKGVVLTDIRKGNDLASAIIVLADGSMIAGGNSNSGNTNDYALIKYDKNGKIDPGFGAGNK